MSNKKKFIVGIREVHIRSIEVEAEDADEAINLANNKQEDELNIEYSHCLSQDNWSVEEV
jgi:hypothetical protein